MVNIIETVNLPLVPLRGIIVFPNMIMHLDIGRDKSVNALEAAMVANRRIFLVAQKSTDEESPNMDEIFNIGTIAEVRQIIKIPDGNVRVLVEGIHRGMMIGYNEFETYTEAEVEVYEDTWADSLQLEALVRGVVHEFEEWVKLSRRIPAETFVAVTILEDIGRLADLITSHLNLKLETKQELLECLDVENRLEKLYTILARELEVLQMEVQINQRVRGQIEKIQKDTYLREQLRAIHKELGEDEDVAENAAEYRQKIKDGDYPDEVKEIIEKEIVRMERLPSMAQESSVIRTYIEWLFDLPWNISTEDSIDIANSRKILDADHYGLEKVKERILDFLAVKVLTKDKPAPILCLVGPPGVGKTSLASSVAKAMGRKFIRASLGGIRDEAEIRGHRRTYVGAMPGRIVQGLKKAGANNPVFLLDEVDKLGKDGYSGDPSSALLEVLDPEQNNSFTDHYIDTPFDLSKILWIVTANNLGTIPKPLRDRMEIIMLSSYTEQEKLEIARRYLTKRQKEENGLKSDSLVFGKGVLQKIISEYTRESGVRELERVIGRVCRKAARKIVEGFEGKIYVTVKNLREFLDKPKYLQTKAEKKPQVGVSTGMAWTEVGGDILPTEAIILKGKGKLLLTGKLGEVMQESAQAGLTYIRSRSDLMKLDDDFYEKNDIHIHVPEGAVPKDGPSAGITMATAMISALTKRKVRSDVAMTGEITLRGNVLPIGGLKEKVLAAYREGMHTIILPKENARDIEDIPEVVREKLEFVPVENMDEVLKTALLS
ncbi:MAG: endopeptidase La [Selenomonadaceae bacterium]|nr:endopeptidase La [Selenomonadaceae bacterium]